MSTLHSLIVYTNAAIEYIYALFTFFETRCLCERLKGHWHSFSELNCICMHFFDCLIVYFKSRIFFKSYFVSHKRDGITLDSDYASSHPLTLRHICVSVSVIDNYIHRAHARNISNTVILFTVRKKNPGCDWPAFFQSAWLPLAIRHHHHR